MVAASRIHHCCDTLIPSLLKSKNVVLSTAETNVPGRKSIVIAAIVIIDAESRCVCSATFKRVNTFPYNSKTDRSSTSSDVPLLLKMLSRYWYATLFGLRGGKAVGTVLVDLLLCNSNMFLRG